MIEVKEEVKIGNVILEKGDKIKVLEDSSTDISDVLKSSYEVSKYLENLKGTVNIDSSPFFKTIDSLRTFKVILKGLIDDNNEKYYKKRLLENFLSTVEEVLLKLPT